MSGAGWARARAFAPLAGMLVGALLAATGLVSRSPADRPLPDGAVARVGDRFIAREELDRVVASLAADARDPHPDLRRMALDRLIDEELLVQEGEALGLAGSEPRLRAELARAVIDLSNAEAEAAEPPSDEALRAEFAARPEAYGSETMVRVEAAFASGPGAADRLARAFEDPAVALDPPPIPVPTGPIRLVELERLLGPSAARAVAGLSPSARTPPLPVAGGSYVLRLVAREARAPAFEDARPRVRAELARRRADVALRRRLDALARATPIVRAEAP